jgi:hypothetical protein
MNPANSSLLTVRTISILEELRRPDGKLVKLARALVEKSS